MNKKLDESVESVSMKLEPDDIFIAMVDLIVQFGDDRHPPHCGEVHEYLQANEGLSHAEVTELLSRPISNVIGKYVDDQLLCRRWHSSAYRYTLTEAGKKYYKKLTGDLPG